MDKVHSTSAKVIPLLPDFCHPNVLVTWQHSVPELDLLRWANNGSKLNKQSEGNRKIKTAIWFFMSSWQISVFGFCIPSHTIVESSQSLSPSVIGQDGEN